MIYREPISRTVEDLETAFESPDPNVVSSALVDAAHFAEVRWLLPVLLKRCSDDQPGVRQAALVGLSTLARRRVLRPERTVWKTVLVLADSDPDLRVQGEANDTMDIFELYAKLGWKGRPRP